jgi:hypothetical protein
MTVGTKRCICASICVPPRMRSNAVGGGGLMYSELGVGWCSYDASTVLDLKVLSTEMDPAEIRLI